MAIPSVTDVLLQQAMLDAQDKPDPAVAMLCRSRWRCSCLEHWLEQPLHMSGRAINAMKDSLAAQQGIKPWNGTENAWVNSTWMLVLAGGLVGAIAGGALGAGIANMMKQSSPAGKYACTCKSSYKWPIKLNGTTAA